MWIVDVDVQSVHLWTLYEIELKFGNPFNKVAEFENWLNTGYTLSWPMKLRLDPSFQVVLFCSEQETKKKYVFVVLR